MITGHSENQALGAALIVTRDPTVSGQISEVLREHALSVELSSDMSLALERLSRQKFEAVVVDSSLARQAPACVQQIRRSASNRTAVTFAITSDKDHTTRALAEGFGFVLERPLTDDAIRHTLRVAYGMIVRERRRYYRHPVVIPAVLNRKGGPKVFGRTRNISESGVALSTSIQLEPGSEGTLQFTLPDGNLEIRADCRVRWSNANGDMGLSFLFLPFSLASELQAWLAQKLEDRLPEAVAQQFRQLS